MCALLKGKGLLRNAEEFCYKYSGIFIHRNGRNRNEEEEAGLGTGLSVQGEALHERAVF